MIAALIVHCSALAAGVGLIAGWRYAPLGVAAGVVLAVWDEVQERRRDHVVVVVRAPRGGRG